MGKTYRKNSKNDKWRRNKHDRDQDKHRPHSRPQTTKLLEEMPDISCGSQDTYIYVV